MLDYRVETFLTVCRDMNFTKAAKHLGITQPAVTQHIRFMEDHYGVSLFSYQKKQLSLTREGRILYERLTSLTNDEEKIQEELASVTEDKELVSVGVTMTIGEYAIVPAISAYLARHPEVNLELHYGNTTQLLEQLKNGKISMALVEGYYPADQYDHINFSHQEFIPVCAAGHGFACGTPETLKDLVQERLLIREKGSGTRNILERSLALQGMSVEDFHSYAQVENMHTIIELLQNDCGISFLYKVAALEELKNGALQEISLADFQMSHEFDFIWDKNSLYAESIKGLAEELRPESPTFPAEPLPEQAPLKSPLHLDSKGI